MYVQIHTFISLRTQLKIWKLSIFDIIILYYIIFVYYSLYIFIRFLYSFVYDAFDVFLHVNPLRIEFYLVSEKIFSLFRY